MGPQTSCSPSSLSVNPLLDREILLVTFRVTFFERTQHPNDTKLSWKNMSIYFHVFRWLNSWNCVLTFLSAYVFSTIFRKEQGWNTRRSERMTCETISISNWVFSRKNLLFISLLGNKYSLFYYCVAATQSSDRNIVFISLCGHLHLSVIYINHVKMALWMWFYTHRSQETQNYGSQSNFKSSSFHINCILRQESYHQVQC